MGREVHQQRGQLWDFDQVPKAALWELNQFLIFAKMSNALQGREGRPIGAAASTDYLEHFSKGGRLQSHMPCELRQNLKITGVNI